MKLINVIVIIALNLGSFAHKGRKFLLIFPPDYQLNTSGSCRIVINTDYPTEVSIQYLGTEDNVTVDNGSYIHYIPCTIRAPVGHSDKGVIVESDYDISVQVYSLRGSIGDAYLALPTNNQGTEHILVSTDKPCGSGSINNFYTVAAEQDNTVVFVYTKGPGGYVLVDTINLDSLGTYTNGSTSLTLDYTGWKLVSSSPISVVSGTACFRAQVDSCGAANGGYMFSPSTDQAGHQFIIPKLTKQNPGDSGAYIRVISFTQNNLITLPDQSIQESLNSGQFFQHYVSPYDAITRIDCTERCVVVLYNELKCGTGEGGFLLYVTPLDRGTDYVKFTAIESTDTHPVDNFITIIADSPNVLLNDEYITGWRLINDWDYFDVAVHVNHGEYTLESAAGGTFVGFVYGHIRDTSFKDWGYGTEIIHNDILPPPEVPGEVPTYRISLVSNWTSAGDMNVQCINQYTNELRQKTLQMAVVLNGGIGEAFCVGFSSEEMRITSSTSSFFSSTSSGYAFVSFLLTPESHIAMGDVLDCANEIAVYSKPHVNWGAPLLDPLPNCADPVFETGVFYDGDHQWFCQDGKVNEEYSSSIPSYYIELVDVGKTDDDSDLSPECAFRYSLSLDEKALWMRLQLNSMVGSQLCQGMSGIAVAAPQTSFTVTGNSALIHIDYVLTHDSSVSGGEALLCADDVLQYIQCYTNWRPPVLPPETGCPTIQLDNQCFDEASKGWLCNL